MTNTNEKPIRQLSLFFNHSNGDNKVMVGGAVGALMKWDAIISNKLNVDNTEWDDTNAMLLKSEEEHQFFKLLLLEEMISREGTVDKQQLMQTVFIYFVRLMDTLFELTRTKDLTEQFKIIAQKISLQFLQTFHFIKDFFESYINKDSKAPLTYLVIIKVKIVQQLKKVKSGYISPTESGNSLLDLVVAAVIEKLSGFPHISMNGVTYINQLTEEIRKQSKLLLEQNLRDILYSLNFNEENFVMAEYERFSTLTPDTLSQSERLRLLKQEQKAINQIIVRLNCFWTNDMPTLKEQINGWLNEEIQFIESGTSTLTNQNVIPENCDKIHTSLSVAKLAVLLRLLVIDKVIINRNVAPMLKVAAKIFTTLQKDDISFGSLETKYHAPDKATINIVKDLLFKWINILGRL